ncbi:TIGR02680 family protein [Actinocorallia longicatena]|uniref:TIGR02680 family protein n=1 Tax=Actinocorallia longicatena TaxID=111803 RepID=A0ABP6QFB9_9ACTN
MSEHDEIAVSVPSQDRRPQDGAHRFKPTRAGVINLWDYVDEEFAFADGRLVLRGHNGSGKTKALEVLFPFILDGVADARRLDPFSGDNRTMKSNLLYRGQESEHGYVWMEFARPVETVTLVIGLRAHKHRDGVVTSFFVTGMRLGVDFGLLNVDGRPLTERQLRESLEPGSHAKTATDYRELVDHRLFGLGRERYDQLLDLLLALRRPLLAKDLDPAKVSATLTAGLSPVDEGLVEQAARDFENLAAVQHLHDDLTTAHTAVRAFLHHYTNYLRVHARFQLDRIAARRDQAVDHGAQMLAATTEADRARTGKSAAESARAGADESLSRLRSRLSTLKNADAYKAQGDLDRLRHQVADDESQLAKDSDRLSRSLQHATELRTETESAKARLDMRRAAITRHESSLAEAAHSASISPESVRSPAAPASKDPALAAGDEGVAPGDGEGVAESAPVGSGSGGAGPRGSDPAGASGARPAEDAARSAAARLASVRARATARRDDIAVVRAAVDVVEARRADRMRVEKAQAKVAEELRAREEECAAAEAAVEAARAVAKSELEAWTGRWEQASAGPLFEILDLIGRPGAPTLGEAFADLSEARRTGLIEKSAEVKHRADEVAVELADLGRERAKIAAERDDAPQHSPLRPAPREDRPGAPFWRLVRFADGLPDPDAASLEGALHAAGILTAWLHPTVAETRAAHADLTPDAFLLPLGGGPSDGAGRPGRTLADVLVPEEQDAVDAEVILGALRGIPLVDGLEAGAWGVSLRGQYSYGVHVGAFPKERPEYIGTTFRARRRRERIAECDEAVARLEAERAELAAEGERLRGLLEDLGTARRELPDVLPVQQALSTVDRVAALLGRVRGEAVDAAKTVDGAVAELEAAVRRLRQTAAEREMPSDPGEIAAVARAVDDFVAAGEQLAREHESLLDAEGDLESRLGTVRRLDEQNAEDAENLAERREQVEAAREQLTARTEALGASLQEILRQISEAEGEIKAAERLRHGHDARVRAEHDALVKAEAAIEHGGRALAEAMDVLLEQIVAFEPFARPDLRPILGVPITTLWPERWDTSAEIGAAAVKEITEGRDPAEAIEAALPEAAEEIIAAFAVATSGGRAPSDTQRKNTRDAMSEALKEFSDALDDCEEDYRLDLDAADIVTVQILDVEGRGSVSSFAERIAGRLGEQSVLLEERERTVLEDELLSSLAQQIFDRVQAAKGLVKGMDSDTRSRPMSTGSTVGIRWVRSDKLDDSQRAVASLLGRDSRHLGPTGLAELRGHLRQLIRARRTQQTRATYLEVLRSVVDYRTWFEFQLLLTEPHATEPVRLTRGKHSQMSGGEKSAAIHLPLFAAANALYSSAKDTCPRMIALDEAFAGIDDRYKPELLGLTVKFDLDMFMTGHDLWASYPTVPMAAHYDMHSDKASHTVSAMLVLWDGTQLLDADATYSGNEDLTTTLLGFRPHRRSPTADGLLAPLLSTP